MRGQHRCPNTYFVCSKGDGEPTPWKPWEDYTSDDTAPAYLNEVAASMASRLEVSGLVFYFTSDTRALPSYGKNVVAVVLGDELCRIPNYSHRVRAVFKCYGINPSSGIGAPALTRYQLLTLIHFGAHWVQRLPSLLNYYSHHIMAAFRKPTSQHIYDIPIGYGRQLDLPIKEFDARPYDVSFAGSVDHEAYRVWSPKFWLGTPKSLSRRQMITSVEQLIRQHPEYRVKLSVTSSFQASRTADVRAYSEELMDTKICLVPRGASLETFRFFEAMRYGCVVIAEALPSRWFYDGSPALQVSDWSALPQLVPELLQGPNLEIKHQESLEWWRSKCSEVAVGTYMANVLNSGGEPKPK